MKTNVTKTVVPRKKALTAEVKQKREARAFHRKIKNMFCDMGFSYIQTEGKEFKLGSRNIEIDAAYFKDNILLLSEDTIGRNNSTNHVLKKQESAQIIERDTSGFLDYFANTYPNAAKQIESFGKSRIKVCSLYFSKHHGNWTEEDRARYSSLRLIPVKVLEYFCWMSRCIKRSAIYELYRYLGLHMRDVGVLTNRGEDSTFNAPIVYPTQFIGGDDRVRVVSFMISAKDLLKIAYVMRRDGWEDSEDVYQRLVERSKIKKIREFLCNCKTTFYNNIIAVLPDTAKVVTPDGLSKSIFHASDESTWSKLSIPNDFRLFVHMCGSRVAA